MECRVREKRLSTVSMPGMPATRSSRSHDATWEAFTVCQCRRIHLALLQPSSDSCLRLPAFSSQSYITIAMFLNSTSF